MLKSPTQDPYRELPSWSYKYIGNSEVGVSSFYVIYNKPNHAHSRTFSDYADKKNSSRQLLPSKYTLPIY